VIEALGVAPHAVTYLPLDRADTAGARGFTRHVAHAVSDALVAGQFTIVLGGDHTVALGSVLGVRESLRALHGRSVPLFILWLDAHPDVNTPETSPSGNLHGMALSGLLGRGPLSIRRPLRPDRVVIAGARTFDPGELAFLRARPGIELWDVATLRGDRWRHKADALLDRVRRARGRLYVSLDLDVLDPSYAPGVVVPEKHGALPSPLLALLRHLGESGLLAGADVVELYPPSDPDGRTAALAAQAVRALSAGHPSVAAQAAHTRIGRAAAA
jgi:arginase